VTHDPPSVCDSVRDQFGFLRDPVDVLLAHGTENDVTRMTIPGYGLRPTEYYVVSHPGYANEVLERRDTFRQYSSVRHALPAVDEGFLSNGTGEWAERRTALESAFEGETFRRFVGAMEDQIVRDVGNLETGVEYRVDKLMRSILIRATTSAVAGETPDPAVVGRLSRAVDAALQKTSFGVGTALPVWMPTPSFLSFWSQFHSLRGWTGDLAADLPEDSVARVVRRELELPEAELSRIVQLLVVAGFVSPSVMVTNALSLLFENPAYVESLVAELGSRSDEPRTLEDVRRSSDGIRWTLFESLRLYPPTFNLTRRVESKSASLGPYELEEGEFVWIDQWSLGRDVDEWDQPSSFAPERWVDLGTDRPSFVPFGAGPRECFGKHAALVAGELILANLLGRYQFAETETSLSLSTVTGGASLSLESPRIRLERPGERVSPTGSSEPGSSSQEGSHG